MRLLSVVLPLLLAALVYSEEMRNYREDYQVAMKKFAKEGGLMAAGPESQKEHFLSFVKFEKEVRIFLVFVYCKSHQIKKFNLSFFTRLSAFVELESNPHYH